MTALHRVKAYFGMVPADELDAYDGYGDHDPYGERPSRAGDRYDAYAGDRYGRRRHESDRFESDRYESDRFDERYDSYEDRYESDRYERRAVPERSSSDDRVRTPRPRDPESEGRAERELPRLAADDRATPGDRDEEADVSVRSSARGRSWEQNTGPNHTSRSRGGALAAVGSSTTGSAGGSLSGSLASGGGSGTEALRASGAAALALSEEPVRPVRAVEAAPAKSTDTPAVPEITTLRPTSYNEARVIGERYRDGIPVIMNLTEMDDAAAKRLVDFAAGLAFALRGSIEKVTNRVFLLSPPNVEVSATERRKFAETS